MRDDSIKKRYFYKLVVRIIGLVFYLARVTIVPRALGPADFGSFTFLERFFSSIINFFDFGSSSAFFNYNSKNKSSGPIILFYSIFSFCLPLVLSLFILIVWLLGFSELFWPEQQAVYIYAGAGFAWLLWLSNLIYGFTISSPIHATSRFTTLDNVCLQSTPSIKFMQSSKLVFLTIDFEMELIKKPTRTTDYFPRYYLSRWRFNRFKTASI